jgi:hypothetical protein
MAVSIMRWNFDSITSVGPLKFGSRISPLQLEMRREQRTQSSLADLGLEGQESQEQDNVSE